jgi:hypothetical protein
MKMAAMTPNAIVLPRSCRRRADRVTAMAAEVMRTRTPVA